MMQLLALVSQTVFYGSEWAGGGGLLLGGGAEGEQLPTKELLVHVMFC